MQTNAYTVSVIYCIFFYQFSFINGDSILPLFTDQEMKVGYLPYMQMDILKSSCICLCVSSRLFAEYVQTVSFIVFFVIYRVYYKILILFLKVQSQINQLLKDSIGKINGTNPISGRTLCRLPLAVHLILRSPKPRSLALKTS